MPGDRSSRRGSRRGSRGRRGVPLEVHLRRRSWVWWAKLVLVLAVLAATMWADRCGWFFDTSDALSRFDGQPYVVVRVIDGDTIDVRPADGDGGGAPVRVRLWGIDCPESAKPREGAPAEPFADAATELTRRRCDGATVRLIIEPHRVRDHYGRLLAFIELPDGTLLNEELLAAGLARADDRWDHRHLQRFLLIAAQARRERVGLWADGD